MLSMGLNPCLKNLQNTLSCPASPIRVATLKLSPSMELSHVLWITSYTLKRRSRRLKKCKAGFFAPLFHISVVSAIVVWKGLPLIDFLNVHHSYSPTVLQNYGLVTLNCRPEVLWLSHMHYLCLDRRVAAQISETFINSVKAFLGFLFSWND